MLKVSRAYELVKKGRYQRWYQGLVMLDDGRQRLLRRRWKTASQAVVYAGRVSARVAVAGRGDRHGYEGESAAAAATTYGVGGEGVGVDYATGKDKTVMVLAKVEDGVTEILEVRNG